MKEIISDWENTKENIIESHCLWNSNDCHSRGLEPYPNCRLKECGIYLLLKQIDDYIITLKNE